MHCHFIYSADYYSDIGEHVFPTVKFRLVFERLQADADVPAAAFLEPAPATREDALLVHASAYVEDLMACRCTPRTMASELPLSEEIVRAYFLGTGGTILACETALQHGMAMNLAGGFHHCFPDHAEGFCYLNDVAIGVRRLKARCLLERAAVIDCDLHQGNGTAFIFRDDPSVFTFSIHQEYLYPVKQRSDLDIGLRNGASDEEYLGELRPVVPHMLDEHRPDLAIYLAGADPYEGDQLGDLRLSFAGLKERDEIVASACAQRGIPLAAVLAGGYAVDTDDTIRIHHTTCRVMWEKALAQA